MRYLLPEDMIVDKTYVKFLQLVHFFFITNIFFITIGNFELQIGKISENFQMGLGPNFSPKSGPKKHCHHITHIDYPWNKEDL
jgi:hypothetical protein